VRGWFVSLVLLVLTGPAAGLELVGDLDGDGHADSVQVRFDRDVLGIESFHLRLGDETFSGQGAGMTGAAFLVDVDTTDTQIEILIAEDGPSDDPATSFVRWDGERFQLIGKLPGKPDQKNEPALICDGAGTITTRQRGKVLHTWSYEARFHLANDTLVEEPAELYDMGLYPLTMKHHLPLLMQPGDEEPFGVLRPGEHVQLVATDNRRWIHIQREDGLLDGWFEVQGFHRIPMVNAWARDVFEGLNQAD
jgi:hypothetical protein